MWKMIGHITAALTGITLLLGGGYAFHTTYEDEPKILAVKSELVAENQKTKEELIEKNVELKKELVTSQEHLINGLILYHLQTEIRQYEDSIEEIREKQRDGTVDRYELRKLDRSKNRIKQLEREIENLREE